jgi:hypothetical protein
MNQETKTTLEDIRVAAAGDLEWFAPPDRKQFLGVETLTAFALILLSSFLAGMKKAAEDKAEDLGKTVFRYLWEAITDLFAGKKTGKAEADVDKESADAVAAVASLTETARNDALNTVEGELKQVLLKNLSPVRANRLAKSVRGSIEKHLLGKRASQ